MPSPKKKGRSGDTLKFGWSPRRTKWLGDGCLRPRPRDDGKSCECWPALEVPMTSDRASLRRGDPSIDFWPSSIGEFSSQSRGSTHLVWPAGSNIEAALYGVRRTQLPLRKRDSLFYPATTSLLKRWWSLVLTCWGVMGWWGKDAFNESAACS